MNRSSIERSAGLTLSAGRPTKAERRVVLAGASLLVMTIAISGPTFAQSATQPAVSGQTLETVVVTARKKTENLQDVPLSITVVGGQQLQDDTAKNLQDIINLTPGVIMTGSPAEANQAPVIRGLYNLNNAGGGTSNVSVFVDGVYIENTSALSIGLLDLERVEIIKGPTSALYGRTGFAGAINFISKTPTDEFHSTGDAELGDNGRYNVTADVNGPIVSGILRGGLGVYYGTADGDYHDSVTGLKAGGFEKKDVKATFDFTPTSKLDISGGYYYGDDHFDQTALVTMTENCGGGTEICGKYTPNPIEVADIPASSGNSGNTRKVESANVHIRYNLDWADLSYIWGYNRVIEREYQDFSGLRYGLNFPLSPGPGTANVYELFGGDQDTNDFSHELRLTSKQNQPLRWSIGGDYYQAESALTTLIGFDGAQIPAGQQIVEFFGFLPNNIFVTPNGSPSTSNYTDSTGTDANYSFFATGDYDVTSRLTASGEVRYSKDAQTQYIQHNSFISDTFAPYGPAIGTDFYYTNYRGTLKYKVNAASMAYVSVATGTKPGGFNQRATIASELSYQPENNTTYEVGGKTQLLDNRLQLDVAVYHIDDKGLQINGPSSDPHNVGQVVKNFGSTSNDGFEFSAIYAPVRMATFSLGVAYTDPTYNSGSYDFNGAAICAVSCPGRVVTYNAASGPTTAVNLKGLQEQFTSKIIVTLAGDFKGHLTGPYDWYAHGDYRYSSKQYGNAEDSWYQGDINIVNLNAGVKWDHFRFGLYVKNALDDRTPTYAQPATELNGTTEYIASLPDARNYGVDLTYRF